MTLKKIEAKSETWSEVRPEGCLSIPCGLIILIKKTLASTEMGQNASKTLKNQGKPPISLLSKQDQAALKHVT